MTQWVMVADLERCVGCQTCTAACRHANATSPAVQWRKVLDIESGSYPNVSRTFVPTGCQHCADPPCMHVCPSTATRRRADGIVTIDYDICIGCAYCDVACPYQARFKIDAPHFAYGGTALQNEIEREDPRRIGVAQKCTYCSDRIDFGLANGLTPGTDDAATPACVNSCIADALHFGDIDDSNSNVSRLLREQRHFRMHEELGTEPGFYYLYGKADEVPSPRSCGERVGASGGTPRRLRRGDPVASSRGEGLSPANQSSFRGTRALRPSPASPLSRLGTLSPLRGERELSPSLRTKGVAPWHQQHWDWKAAGNFICGGAGTGLFAFAAILGTSFWVGWAALGLVALGLFLVLLKIGRPLRFILVLRQPQRSWMAREAWIAAFFFPLGALAIWLDSRALMLAAAILALCFLFSQAMILYECKGIPAWRARGIVPLTIATGLAEGAGLYLIAAAAIPPREPMTQLASLAVVILAAIRAWSWKSYLGGLRTEGAPERSIAVLENFERPFLFLGLALPIVLIIIAWIISSVALCALAAFFAVGAGAALKFVLVTRAGYNQGFAVPHIPARGIASGISLGGVKPGWAIASGDNEVRPGG
jgi:phenylacetyl-CoA:acceptor oxidoreductase subunit 1